MIPPYARTRWKGGKQQQELKYYETERVHAGLL